jgi:hypothetical protein
LHEGSPKDVQLEGCDSRRWRGPWREDPSAFKRASAARPRTTSSPTGFPLRPPSGSRC